MSNVIYRPGNEPESIKQKLGRLFEKLDAAYPDKLIIGLYQDHKHWAETITELYRTLGYSSGNEFLSAYGYKTVTGAQGRPSTVDPNAVIEQLKTKYPNGTSLTVSELQKDNPDIPWKSIMNKSNEFFGMTFAKYLAKEGIIKKVSVSYEEKRQNAKEKGHDEDVEMLENYDKHCMSKYPDQTKRPKSLEELLIDNNDYYSVTRVKNLLKRLSVDGLKHFIDLGVLPKDATLVAVKESEGLDLSTKYVMRPFDLPDLKPAGGDLNGSRAFETEPDRKLGYPSAFLNTVFRGLKEYVEMAVKYLESATGEKIKAGKTGIDRVWDLEVPWEFGSSVIEQVMKKYPELKMAAFYEMRDYGIYVCYSPSGYSYVTACRFISGCDHHDDNQYYLSHWPSEASFVEYVNNHVTDEEETIKYRFPYLIEWNRFNYIIIQDESVYLVEDVISQSKSVARKRVPITKKEQLVPESAKEKKSEFFELDGIPFRVIYQPKAALNRLEDWIRKLASGKQSAMTMEYATDINHTGKIPTEYVSAAEAEQKYTDFIKVCLLYTHRDMMEKALRSALKKKNGTLVGRRVQHLAFTGLSVNFEFYELCAVNDTENVMVLEIRSTGCSHKYLPAYEAAKTCQEILSESEG